MRIIVILALSICSCQAVIVNCPRPLLENGFFVPHLEIYEHSVTISYGCDTGWKPALKKWWGELTCTGGTWSHTPQCINKTWCITPHVLNAEPVNGLALFYPSDEVVNFNCKPGYEANKGKSVAHCLDGKWSVPVCERKRSSCAPPPRVENGMIEQPYKNVFEHGERLHYVCAKGYEIKRYEYNTCINGQWQHYIQCEEQTCSSPSVRNGEPVNWLKHIYINGEQVEFKCRSSYEFEDTKFAVCVHGTWKLPVCKPRSEPVCDVPRVTNAVQIGTIASLYRTGQSVQFKCNKGYTFEGTDSAVCENGRWKLPACKRSAAGGHVRPETSVVTSPIRECGDHPLIEDGDVIESGRQLKVLCKAFFKLQGPEIVSCVAGQWTELPVCKAPCKLDRTRFLSEYHADEYLPDGETNIFYCKGFLYGSRIQITCHDGQLSYSNCR